MTAAQLPLEQKNELSHRGKAMRTLIALQKLLMLDAQLALGAQEGALGLRFLETLRLTKALLPRTKIHILSNGRTFADRSFAKSCRPCAPLSHCT